MDVGASHRDERPEELLVLVKFSFHSSHVKFTVPVLRSKWKEMSGGMEIFERSTSAARGWWSKPGRAPLERVLITEKRGQLQNEPRAPHSEVGQRRREMQKDRLGQEDCGRALPREQLNEPAQ